MTISFWEIYGETAKTAIGFFWKAGWAFILGYFISSMIQTFVPKGKLTRYMGDISPKSILLSTGFGAASSSCSFAALSTARALVLKGANFIAAVAFMFASTNLVIELGILIFIFLGWQFLLAELLGGLVLITLSTVIMKIFYPKQWLKEARKKVEENAMDYEENFNWKERIKSKEGWYLVGHHFIKEWKMVWQEILIGFTIAGFVATFVSNDIWSYIFMTNVSHTTPGWIITLENTVVGPIIAALTFIGSMGNIPLATVLNTNGVAFAGIMAFIYSDLMVPPLVAVNAKYYGRKIALYIAGVMYISIIGTALILNSVFSFLHILPQSSKEIVHLTQFKIDYTFWMNILFVFIAFGLFYLYRRNKKVNNNQRNKGMMSHKKGAINLKAIITYVCIGILCSGLIVYFVVK